MIRTCTQSSLNLQIVEQSIHKSILSKHFFQFQLSFASIDFELIVSFF